MDDWQQAMGDAIARAANLAADVVVYKETGVKQGGLAQAAPTGPSWFPTYSQPNAALGVGQAGAPTGAAAGLPQWLPVLLIVGAVGLIAWKLAK